jgi:hypothetical protein
VCCREDIKETLKGIQEEDDWFFGAEFRMEGEQLYESGVDLRDDQRNLSAEVAVKIRKIEEDFNDFEKERREDMARERAAFEAQVRLRGSRCYHCDEGIGIRNRACERDWDRPG